MRSNITKKYKGLSEAILSIIYNFKNKGNLIYGGSRNTLKTFKVAENEFTVKAFKQPNIINRYVYRFIRKSKAERSYLYAHKLLAKNIGTPEPVAFFENRTGIQLLDSYYVCKYINYDYTFRDLVEHQDKIKNWEFILRAFTRFTFKLHEAGIEFLDHSPGNTLIVLNSDEPQFYLVDLNRMNFGKLSVEQRIQNFAKLTPRRDMVQIMSDEYAKLIGQSPQEVNAKMWGYTMAFQEGFKRKRKLKKQLKFWKKN